MTAPDLAAAASVIDLAAGVVDAASARLAAAGSIDDHQVLAYDLAHAAAAVATAQGLLDYGAKGDGIGIASDLSGRVSAAQGLVTVAKRYLEASDRLIVNVEEAGSALSTASSLRKAKEADDRLSIAVLELFDALGELRLSDKDAGYRSSLYADFTSYASTMSHDPYNEAAVTYNENIRAFPGRLFFSLMGYRSAPVFR